MKTCFFRRNAREHSGIHGDSEMLYAMKGYDDAQGLVYLLDGNWGGSIDHSSDLGCHFGYNSFLDYGAEFMCTEFSPIREICSLSGLTERKSADADWKWVLFQQQASLHNLSTLLVSKDRFDGSVATILKSDVPKNDVKAATESSILCAASKTQLSSHARRNRPKRVHMIPTVDSNAASIACIAKGHACVSSLPIKTFSIQNDNGVATYEDAASRLISSCAPPCVDKLCLASLLCDEKSIPLEKNFLDVLPTPTDLTDLVPSQNHLCAIKPSLFKSVPCVTNQSNDRKEDFKVSHEGGFDATDQEIEMLGKALCHAQTRARLAEKLAGQTLQERDRIQQLLIREAWITYSYRQRALTLELENRLLKLCPKLELGLWANRENAHIYKSVEPRSRALSKLAKKQHPLQNRKELYVFSSSHGKKSKPRRGVSLSFAVGFAFVLGLSIAGTGIVVVWSVGWMFFS